MVEKAAGPTKTKPHNRTPHPSNKNQQNTCHSFSFSIVMTSICSLAPSFSILGHTDWHHCMQTTVLSSCAHDPQISQLCRCFELTL